MYGDKSYRQNIEDLMLDLDRKRSELMYDFNSSSDEFERRHYKYRIAALSMMFTRPTHDFSICEGYGIDPDFAKAVAVVESGWMHNSSMARNKNNIYGLIGKEFRSIDECIHYFCRLIKTKYPRDIDSIARKYCPPNAEEWARKVRGIMWKLKRK